MCKTCSETCLEEMPTHLKAFICEGSSGLSVSPRLITAAEGFSVLTRLIYWEKQRIIFVQSFYLPLKWCHILIERYGRFWSVGKHEYSSLNLHICLTRIAGEVSG